MHKESRVECKFWERRKRRATNFFS